MCVEWLWNREVKCSNICVGKCESQTYAVNQSLCRQGRKNDGVEKVEYRWDSDSRAMRLPSKAVLRRWRRICVMLNVAGIDMLASDFAVLLCLDLERISFYIVLPSSNRINFGLSLFFATKVIGWSKNYLKFYFLWVILSTFHRARSLCAKTYFFILEKILAPATFGKCSPGLLIGIAIILFVR